MLNKNFPVTVDGKEYWISRSVACSGLIYTCDENGEKYILAVKRGSVSDRPYMWCLPGGYLDYDESTLEGAIREIKEETGVSIDKDTALNMMVFDKPAYSKKQVITFVYLFCVQNGLNIPLTTIFSEPNEIDEIKWIKESEVDKYEWMYNEHFIQKLKNEIDKFNQFRFFDLEI